MGSGPTPAEQTQKSQQSGTSTSGPPQAIQPYLQQTVDQMGGYFGQGAPSLYSGNYTAAPSQATQESWYGLRDYGLNGQGAGTTTPLNTQLTNATLSGDYLNVDRNPYFQSAIEASLRAPTENFANKIIPTLRSTFAGAGRPGGGLEGTALQDATTSFNRSVSDATAKVGAQAYSDERQRQLSTQSMLPSFQNMDLQRLAAIAQAGAGEDAYSQKLLDEQIQRHNYAQTGGLDFLTGLAQRIQAAYPGGYTQGTSNTSSTGTGQGASNPGASTMSTIMGGVGTAASIAGMFV